MWDFAVTGAKGFVGARLCRRLGEAGYSILAFTREPVAQLSSGHHNVQARYLPDLQRCSSLPGAFDGVDCVVHLAGRVHDQSEQDSNVYDSINVRGTQALLESAIAGGVRRFVFVSTIKVNGESAPLTSAITAESEVCPTDAYSRSKWEAEGLVREMAGRAGIEAVIIRPVLIYGPHVRANFRRLLELVQSGVPLPFGAVANYRSILFVDNLCDLVEVCSRHPSADGEVFLAADARPISTPELMQAIARQLGTRSHLIPVPLWLLEGMAALTGRRELLRRLTGSLAVDIEKNRRLLGWVPPVSTEEGLRQTAAWFLQSRQE